MAGGGAELDQDPSHNLKADGLGQVLTPLSLIFTICQAGITVVMISRRREQVWRGSSVPQPRQQASGRAGLGLPVPHREMGWSRRCHVELALNLRMGLHGSLGTLSQKGARDRDMEFWLNFPGGL